MKQTPLFEFQYDWLDLSIREGETVIMNFEVSIKHLNSIKDLTFVMSELNKRTLLITVDKTFLENLKFLMLITLEFHWCTTMSVVHEFSKPMEMKACHYVHG